MTQTLMAAFDDEPVFPATEKVLFLGGPNHGEEMEVIAGDPTHKVFAKSAPAFIPNNSGLPLVGSGGMEVHTYMRRELGFESGDGERYVRTVYMHEAVPNPDIGQRLLLAALLANFVKGGRKVIPGDVSSGGSDSRP